MESVPPQERKVIERMMVSSFQMRGGSSPETAVMKKITEEHITKYLEGAEIDMKNSYTEKFHKKVFTFLTIVVVVPPVFLFLPPFNLFNLFCPLGTSVILQLELYRFHNFFSGFVIQLVKGSQKIIHIRHTVFPKRYISGYMEFFNTFLPDFRQEHRSIHSVM